MSELPDPAQSWSAALRRLWCAEPEFSMSSNWAGAWFFFAVATLWPFFLFTVVSKVSPTWLLYELPVLYLIWWRLYTRPRMPTIWEVLLGLVMFLVLPVISLGRSLVHWVAESQANAP